MSHYTCVKTLIQEQKCLVNTLADMGFREVESHEKAQHLYGYQGDIRPQTAEVIIRREHVGRLSNDIGFNKNENGVFDAIISEFDRQRYGNEWLNELNRRYAHLTVKAQVLEQGLIIEEERVLDNGEIELVVCERF